MGQGLPRKAVLFLSKERRLMKRITFRTAAVLLAVLVLYRSLTAGVFGAEPEKPKEEEKPFLSGEVLHTDAWNRHIEDANRYYEECGVPEKRHGEDTFWSGEKFVLRAAVSGEELPDAITVSIAGTEYETRLWRRGDFYEGELFEADMLFRWGQQGPEVLVFVFEAEAGEASLFDRCRIEVNDEDPYWMLHRKES